MRQGRRDLGDVVVERQDQAVGVEPNVAHQERYAV
jgi:hypothetical protein